MCDEDPIKGESINIYFSTVFISCVNIRHEGINCCLFKQKKKLLLSGKEFPRFELEVDFLKHKVLRGNTKVNKADGLLHVIDDQM